MIPQSHWHRIKLPDLPTAPPSYNFSSEQSAKLEDRAKTLLAQLNAQYTKSLSPNSTSTHSSRTGSSTLSKADKAFIINILKSGTSTDKLSALILLASSSPVHCTSYLAQLLTLCSKKSREDATKTIRSVVDWLKSQGLPDDRKLKWFSDQTGLRDLCYMRHQTSKPALKSATSGKSRPEKVIEGQRGAGDEYLALWAFESWLKKWYLDLLHVMEVRSSLELPTFLC